MSSLSLPFCPGTVRRRMRKVVKQILWSILAFLIIAHVQVFATMLLHPMAGNEFHHIFAELGGGRVDVALLVFVEYVGITPAVALLLWNVL
jgi:hypothetical protein